MARSFAGFSPKAIAFLRQLKKNNSRDWFQPRKDEFDAILREPMLELTGLVADQLRLFAVEYLKEPAKAVNRIYRDVRFSKDKSPYKTNISAMFSRKGLGKTTGGGFYFSLSGEHVEVAGGVYMPMPADLQAIRSAIATDPIKFRKVLEDKRMTRLVGSLRGDQLVRPPKGFHDDASAMDLLRRKQFYYFINLPIENATQPGLDKVLTRYFKAMTPAIDFLNQILLNAHRDKGEDDRPKRPKPMF